MQLQVVRPLLDAERMEPLTDAHVTRPTCRSELMPRSYGSRHVRERPLGLFSGSKARRGERR